MSDAAIIVVTYNSRACFPELTSALEAQTMPFRLIVFDNASEESQRPRREDLPAGAKLIQSDENLGFAAANNRCAAQVEAPLIALLNPDAFPAPDWLERLTDAAARYPSAAGFGSTQIKARDDCVYDGLGDAYQVAGASWRGGYGASRREVSPREGFTFAVCGAAALYRAEAWRAVGGFDERYFCFAEDVDLAFRLRLRGWELVQVASAVVRHVGGASAGTRPSFEIFHTTRNGLWTFVKNMPGALFWGAVPLHALKTAVHYAISVFRSEGKAYRRGIRAGLLGLSETWRARQAVQRSRTASVLSIARALTWSPFALLARQPKIWR
jgi:N-acetylglucosaminyl-diphospho-decaprenol L-rhamnosyltransferase